MFSQWRNHMDKFLCCRLQLQITLVLTAVSFKFMISDFLPKVSYLTVMDKYILVSRNDSFTSQYRLFFSRVVFSLLTCVLGSTFQFCWYIFEISVQP